MTLDDLKRLFTRQTLFRLDSILAPKLVPILYALGLAGLLLWAVRHLFASFSASFGSGLWGLLEIAVFGLFVMLALRIVSEALLVYFKAHEESGDSVNRSRYSASLLDEVREAIRELAEADETDFAEADEYITPATEPAPPVPPSIPPVPPSPPPRAAPVTPTTPVTPPAPVTPVTPAPPPAAAAPAPKPRPVKRTARRTPTPRTPPSTES